jgi:uncharacterized protein
MQICRLSLRLGAALAALILASCSKPAPEPQAAPPPAPVAVKPPEPGLPMWVIRDADSTIYLTGTVHLLPPDVEWRSPKLEAALDEASVLWLELAEIGDLGEFRRKARPILEQHAKSDRPLSSLLTERERGQLTAALERAGMSTKDIAAMDKMKPWFVAQAISQAPLAAAGYTADAGIDITLARMAKEQGDTIKGLETIESQASVLSSSSERQQLAQLRAFIAAPPIVLTGSAWLGGQTFEAWAAGNTLPVEILITTMTMAAGKSGGVDALLKDRNENWAGQIEEMLKGSGVSFIAVGAGHLVGPDSVQKRLKLRGIKAERY